MDECAAPRHVFLKPFLRRVSTNDPRVSIDRVYQSNIQVTVKACSFKENRVRQVKIHYPF